MVRIALISYLVIIKICASDKFQKCSFQRDFAVKLSQSVLEAEHFPFYSLVMCKGKHDPHTTAKMACWICSNFVLFSPSVSLPVFLCWTIIVIPLFVLNNYCFKRNDQLSCDKLSKTRKLQTFILIWQVLALTYYSRFTLNVVITSVTTLYITVVTCHWCQAICAKFCCAAVHCILK